MTEQCAGCKFYVGDDTKGACRRFPPVMVPHAKLQEGKFPPSYFPPVNADKWCGEFKKAKATKEKSLQDMKEDQDFRTIKGPYVVPVKLFNDAKTEDAK